MGNLGKIIDATSFEWLSKVQKSPNLVTLVVAQLVGEQSLPTPEICGSNPAIGKCYLLSTVLNLYLKDENKGKRDREWPIFLK